MIYGPLFPHVRVVVKKKGRTLAPGHTFNRAPHRTSLLGLTASRLFLGIFCARSQVLHKPVRCSLVARRAPQLSHRSAWYVFILSSSNFPLVLPDPDCGPLRITAPKASAELARKNSMPINHAFSLAVFLYRMRCPVASQMVQPRDKDRIVCAHRIGEKLMQRVGRGLGSRTVRPGRSHALLTCRWIPGSTRTSRWTP